MPASEVQSFTDPGEYQENIASVKTELLVTAPGNYRAQLTRITLHKLRLQSGRASLPQIVRAVINEGRSPITFLADAEQPPMRHSGHDLLADDLVFAPSGSEHYKREAEALHWKAMSLPNEDLVAESIVLAGRDDIATTDVRLVRPPPHLMVRLRNLHEAACSLAATTPDILAHPEVARAMEHELVRTMVACLTAGTRTKPSPTRPPRVSVMRRFGRVLEANEGLPLYLPEICAAIGVTDRTLRLHCMEHLGTTPHHYLWLRRMHQARRALMMAGPATSTVTTIATDHGFGELGRFSVSYRKLFGETPSATLRRQPDDRLAGQHQNISPGRFPFLP